jgi:uncharacterized protein DUF3616
MTHRVSTLLPVLATAAFLLPTSQACMQPAFAQASDGKPWTVAGEAADDSDLSGAACSPDGICVLVSDEKHRAWLFTRDETNADEPRILTGDRIRLKPAQGGDESDTEAVAYDDHHFYAIGSHGTARKKNEFQASRYSVYRIDEDGSVRASDRLADILATLPGISEHFCTGAKTASCETLQEGGANIEGLAARSGSLYVGFRAPSPDGEAFVVRVAEDAVFGRADPDPTVFRLHLGQDANSRDLGVRDLAAVSDGFLVLAGPSLPEGDDATGSAAIFHWQDDAAPRMLRDLGPSRKGVKPEGLLVLGENSKGYRVLVIHDGVASGAPLEYQVPRR